MKTEINNFPPADDNLERIVLGSILLQNDLMDNHAGDFNETLFFNAKNKVIGKTLVSMYIKTIPIDLVTLVNNLKKENLLDKAGGPLYISNLTNKASSIFNFEVHLRILQQEALRRSVIQICNEGVRNCFDDSKDVFNTHASVQKKLDDSVKSVLNYSIKSAGEIHNDLLIKSREIASTGIRSGVRSGLTMVDNVTNGWQNSDLIILAGRPSMGKTACAISMSMYPALQDNKCVGIFSLEMSVEQLVARMQSGLSKIDVSKIVKKQVGLSEIDIIDSTGKPLLTAPIYIDDTPNISLVELKGKARKLVKEHNCELIIIDYLQLMKSTAKTYSREQEIAEISRGLKALAKELQIPVIALSQLSRGVESRGGDKKPMLQDLRESGQIEQDADMVLFCYRPEYYGIEEYSIGNEDFDAKGLFMLLIAKHRNGSLGEVPLSFVHELAQVTNHTHYKPTDSDNNRTFVQQDNNVNLNSFTNNKSDFTPLDFSDNTNDNTPF